jgi:hypothetical protein
MGNGYTTECEVSTIGCGGGGGKISMSSKIAEDNRLCPRLNKIHACLENLEGLVDNCSTKLAPILRQMAKNTTMHDTKKTRDSECEAFELINGIDVRIERIHEKVSEIFHDLMV